ncbi:hypothetical protein KEM56_001147 [Ascosphaera pollenicola]|nr:hypothetical protein KEM56_001147 [Ascosphaera pollenicola]
MPAYAGDGSCSGPPPSSRKRHPRVDDFRAAREAALQGQHVRVGDWVRSTDEEVWRAALGEAEKVKEMIELRLKKFDEDREWN